MEIPVCTQITTSFFFSLAFLLLISLLASCLFAFLSFLSARVFFPFASYVWLFVSLASCCVLCPGIDFTLITPTIS